GVPLLGHRVPEGAGRHCLVERGVEHGDLRESGPGGADRLDAGQVGRVLQRRQRGERADGGDDVVVDEDRVAEPVAPVHHPVPGADQVRARAGHAVQDAGDDRLAAAVGEGFGDVARWTLDSQHGLVGADLVGQAAQHPLAGSGGDQRELHRRAARVEHQHRAARGCHGWDATGSGKMAGAGRTGLPSVRPMVPLSHVLTFAAVVSVLIAIPGPSVLFTISRALTVGRRAALLTVAGNELGLCVQLVAVAFGVGAVVERSAQILTVVKFAGAAYLVFLGVQAIRHRTSVAEAMAARVTPVTPLRAIRDGFVVGAANPKTIVFFVVGLPEFVSSAPGHLPAPAQMLILGALFPVIALVLDSAWAAIAGTARQWLVRSPRRLAMIGGTAGLVMIGLGIGVAVTGRKD